MPLWLAFHELYDFPDAFLTTGQLGSLVAGFVGSRRDKPWDYAPYYKSAQPGLAGAFAFLRQHAPEKRLES